MSDEQLLSGKLAGEWAQANHDELKPCYKAFEEFENVENYTDETYNFIQKYSGPNERERAASFYEGWQAALNHRAHEPKVLTVDEIANICLSDEYGLSDSGSARLAQAIHDAIYNGGR